MDNGFTEVLKLHNNNLANGVDVSSIEGALALGYSENGYSTIAIVPFGDGEITVFSGSFSINQPFYQLDDIGQVVASGVSSSSMVLVYEAGEKGPGDLTLEIQLPEDAAGAVVYVSVGGTYIRYAEAYHHG